METVKIELAPQAFNTIMAALEELPHKHSRPVIDDLVRQVQAQQQPPAPPADTPPAPAAGTEAPPDQPNDPA